jgi:hypothetical protein
MVGVECSKTLPLPTFLEEEVICDVLAGLVETGGTHPSPHQCMALPVLLPKVALGADVF